MRGPGLLTQIRSLYLVQRPQNIIHLLLPEVLVNRQREVILRRCHGNVSAAARAAGDGPVLLLVNRGGNTMFLAIEP